MGLILAFGVVIGLVEVISPRTAIKMRTRSMTKASKHQAHVGRWFDSTFGLAPDNPNAERNVRMIGVAVTAGCLLWGWVWFIAGLGDSL